MGATPSLSDVDEDSDGNRVYRWSDGLDLPSVTTVLSADPEKKQALKEWRERSDNPDYWRDRQGILGSLVHHRILNGLAIRPLEPPSVNLDVIRDELGEIEEEAELAIGMWQQADVDPGSQPWVEKPVRNVADGYAGRFDLLTDSRVNTLVDLKVSPEVRDQYRMQLSAYWRALEQTPQYPTPDEAAVVVLHPGWKNQRLTPHVERISEEQADYWYERFLGIKEIFDGVR